MREFRITEAQLDELADLNPEWPEEVARREELVAEIKTQELFYEVESADLNSPGYGVLISQEQRRQPVIIQPFHP